MKKFFGTDGIRGIPFNEPLDPLTIRKIGAASAKFLKKNSPKGKKQALIIVRDTRDSGEEILSYLSEGIQSEELEVWDAGILPTPAVSYLIRNENVLGGGVISASHNPSEYNGIKFFSWEGMKLSPIQEEEIEKEILASNTFFVKSKQTNRKYQSGKEKYVNFVVEKVAKKQKFNELHVVLDCANGANFEIAPQIFSLIGAKVISKNVNPNGKNINANCGSLYPEVVCEAVKNYSADCGFSFDGDGDRVIASDEIGNYLDGDYLMGILSNYYKSIGKLTNSLLVTTVMSNLGLHQAMEKIGIKTVQTPVGDRAVLEEMLLRNALIGGEQSGHIIFSNYSLTGDGIITAIQTLKVMQKTGKKLSNLAKIMEKFPQVIVNVKIKKKIYFEKISQINQLVKNLEEKISPDGRILLRYSGTEPVVRIMVEGKSESQIKEISQIISKKIQDFINEVVE